MADVPADGGDEDPGLLREDDDGDLALRSFAVGYAGEDVDDVSPPEMHAGELPVGFEVDSPLPHLGTGLDDGLDPEPAPLFELAALFDDHQDPADQLHPHGDSPLHDVHDDHDDGDGDGFGLHR